MNPTYYVEAFTREGAVDRSGPFDSRIEAMETVSLIRYEYAVVRLIEVWEREDR